MLINRLNSMNLNLSFQKIDENQITFRLDRSPRLSLISRVVTIVAGIALGALAGALIGGLPGFMIGALTGALIGTTAGLITDIARKKNIITKDILLHRNGLKPLQLSSKSNSEVENIIFKKFIFDSKSPQTNICEPNSSAVMLFHKNENMNNSIISAANNAMQQMEKILKRIEKEDFPYFHPLHDYNTNNCTLSDFEPLDPQFIIKKGLYILQLPITLDELISKEDGDINPYSSEIEGLYAVAYYISRQFSPHIRLINTIKGEILTDLEKEGIDKDSDTTKEVVRWAQDMRNRLIPEECVMMNKFMDLDDIDMNDM